MGVQKKRVGGGMGATVKAMHEGARAAGISLRGAYWGPARCCMIAPGDGVEGVAFPSGEWVIRRDGVGLVAQGAVGLVAEGKVAR